MIKKFQKLMRTQVQESLDSYRNVINKTVPQAGWIRTIRDALGMSTRALAAQLECRPSNITAIERREKDKKITLETLDKVAQAMGCKLVYSLVPLESFDVILEKRARKVAQKRIQLINHSMRLENQGLTDKQLKQQEDDLVRELLQEHPKKLWKSDAI